MKLLSITVAGTFLAAVFVAFWVVGSQFVTKTEVTYTFVRSGNMTMPFPQYHQVPDPTLAGWLAVLLTFVAAAIYVPVAWLIDRKAKPPVHK